MAEPEKAPKVLVEPLALIGDEPAFTLDEDRLKLQNFADTVAAVSLGTNPVFSVGGQLTGGDTETLSIGADDQAAVITDVILTATDRYAICRARSRVILEGSTATLASFGVGHNSNSSSGLDSVLASLQSGIRIEPGIAVTITSVALHEYACHGSKMEVEYTVSGYYAQP